MKFQFDKRNTVYLLFIIVVSLIFFNLILKKIFIKVPDEEKVILLQPSEMDERFSTILKNFGIENKLIKRREPNTKTNRNRFYSYKITVPLDLPIPVILDDIYSEFSGKVYGILSKETEMGGKSLVQIKAEESLIISAEFSYSKDIVRKKGWIGIMLNQFAVETQQDSLIFDIPESFCVLLRPSVANSKTAVFISKKNKEYAVLIDDNISELKFKLSGDYSIQRLKNIVRTIIGSFSKAVFYVFDEQSDFYGTEGFKIVVNELKKRKIRYKTMNGFINLATGKSGGAVKNFEEVMTQLGSQEKKIVLIKKETFSELLPSVAFFRKSGVKFVNVSSIIK